MAHVHQICELIFHSNWWSEVAMRKSPSF